MGDIRAEPAVGQTQVQNRQIRLVLPAKVQSLLDGLDPTVILVANSSSRSGR